MFFFLSALRFRRPSRPQTVSRCYLFVVSAHSSVFRRALIMSLSLPSSKSHNQSPPIVSSRRPPRLPWDVLLMIVKQVDHQTLVVLSKVSLELLVATAPILYRDVEIKSVKGLWSLFCERKKETDVSSVAPTLAFLLLSRS